MSKVYVLQRGEDYEGSVVQAVYSTWENASEAVQRYIEQDKISMAKSK